MFFRSTFLATSLLVGMRPLENWLIFNNLDFCLASPILHHTLWHNNFIQLGSYTFFKSLTILTCTQHFNNFGILAFENILLFASGFINRWSLKGSLGMDESVTDLHIIFFEMKDWLCLQGMVLISPSTPAVCCRQFQADVYVLFHSGQISSNFQTTIHIGTVCQTAKILKMDRVNLWSVLHISQQNWSQKFYL